MRMSWSIRARMSTSMVFQHRPATFSSRPADPGLAELPIGTATDAFHVGYAGRSSAGGTARRPIPHDRQSSRVASLAWNRAGSSAHVVTLSDIRPQIASAAMAPWPKNR